MKDLPVDDRGYPVPFFVAWVGDKPEFRAMDKDKFLRCVRQKLCWVCGNRLGVNVCFVAGPMCGINRTSSEPPSHLECGRWSAQNCPFMVNPRMVRREDDLLNNAKLVANAPGAAIARNPGVAMLWITRGFEIIQTKTGPLFHMGEAESVEWWACGKPATRAQVMESIDTGLPILEAAVAQEPGGLARLIRWQERFMKWVPV
jgi:hypothetical protein